MTTEELIGKTVEEVRELLRDCTYRYNSIDEQSCIVTCDLKPERYNLTVVDNLITKVTFG